MEQPNSITTALGNQFESCMIMMQTLINVIPPEVWNERYNDVPVWHQVYHVVFFIDHWFRDFYVRGRKDHLVGSFDERIIPELDAELPDGVCISQEEMREYLKRIHQKVTHVFDNMEDEKLGQPIIAGGSRDYTHMDVITGQIRHIMYNIGYLNGLLRERSLEEADWYSYNEGERVLFQA